MTREKPISASWQAPSGVWMLHLGAAVEGKAGGNLPGQGRGGQVVHNEGVHPCLGGTADGFGQIVQLAVVDQNVQGGVDTDPPGMAEGHRPRQCFGVEIAGRPPGVETRKPQIRRVSAAVNSGAKHFGIACRGKDFQSAGRAGRMHTAPINREYPAAP